MARPGYISTADLDFLNDVPADPMADELSTGHGRALRLLADPNEAQPFGTVEEVPPKGAIRPLAMPLMIYR